MHVAVEARFRTEGSTLTPERVNTTVTKTTARTESEEWNIKKLGAEIYKDLRQLPGVTPHGGIIKVTDVGDFIIVLDYEPPKQPAMSGPGGDGAENPASNDGGA